MIKNRLEKDKVERKKSDSLQRKPLRKHGKDSETRRHMMSMKGNLSEGKRGGQGERSMC